MAKLFKTRNDLDAKVRTEVIAIIQANLHDMIDLYSQTKFAHWNVKGPHFIGLHELFDTLAEGVEKLIDITAERLTALGGVAAGTVRQSAAASRVAEFPSGVHEGLEVVAALADAFATVGKGARAAIDEADELGDADTADMFTDASRELDQSLWFLEAHLSK
jgi:starvation-inducible DNA-binding protein